MNDLDGSFDGARRAEKAVERNIALAKVIPHRGSATNPCYEELRSVAPLWVAWYEDGLEVTQNNVPTTVFAIENQEGGLTAFYGKYYF